MIPVIEILEYYFVDILIDNPCNVYVRCKCPFHEGTGKTPDNFSINRENGHWICFNPSCPAKSGSIIRFISLQEKCFRDEAKEILKDRFARGTPWRVLLKAIKKDSAVNVGPLPIAKWPTTMEPIPSNHPWIKKRRYRDKDFRSFKVSYDTTRPAYVFFPIIFKRKLRGFTARDIRKNPIHKWEHDYALPRKRLLYNYDMAGSRDYVFVCEGPLDVIRLTTFGYRGAVAIFGSKGTSDQIALILETWDKVVVVFDNDPAGHSGADKLCETIKEHVKFCAKLELPTDPDDLRCRKEFLGYVKERLQVMKAIKRERNWNDLRKQWS